MVARSAAVSGRLVVTSRQPSRCPYCRAELTGALWSCTGCGTPHHEECMREATRCTVLGCGVLAPARPPRRLSPTITHPPGYARPSRVARFLGTARTICFWVVAALYVAIVAYAALLLAEMVVDTIRNPPRASPHAVYRPVGYPKWR